MIRGVYIGIGRRNSRSVGDTYYDPILGWMILLRDVDGNPVKDVDGKYIYVKKETT